MRRQKHALNIFPFNRSEHHDGNVYRVNPSFIITIGTHVLKNRNYFFYFYSGILINFTYNVKIVCEREKMYTKNYVFMRNKNIQLCILHSFHQFLYIPTMFSVFDFSIYFFFFLIKLTLQRTIHRIIHVIHV